MSCRLTTSFINNLEAIHLENAFIKVGILVGRGSDIFEFYYKPKAVEFLLRLPKGILNPSETFSQIRNTKNQFEDYYYGGWQVCLPNSPAFTYRGAELGQHGEFSLISWQYEIIKDSKEQLILKCKSSCLRLPLRMTRTFILNADSKELQIQEEVLNYGKTHLDIMWGQHIAFGKDFITDGVNITCNAQTAIAESEITDNIRYKRDTLFNWPEAIDIHDKPAKLDTIIPHDFSPYHDLMYLEGLKGNAYYSVTNLESNVGFGVKWDGDLFKTVWLWEEYNATQDFPWWGDCFTLALEPWTSKWTSQPHDAIASNQWLRIEGGQEISTLIFAEAFENKSTYIPK